MLHLLVSMLFLGLLGIGLSSLIDDLTRPLVMQPIEDGGGSTRTTMMARATVVAPPRTRQPNADIAFAA